MKFIVLVYNRTLFIVDGIQTLKVAVFNPEWDRQQSCWATLVWAAKGYSVVV